MLSLIISAVADTPAMCYNDQLLGRWKIEISNIDREYENDQLACDDNFEANQTKYIILRSPNVAIDENGSYGTWSTQYTEAISVRVAGMDYLWYFNYSINPNDQNEVISNCTLSIPGMGWVHEQGITRKYHGCIRAQNIEPTINETINYNGKPEPGPVNQWYKAPNGREYRLNSHKLAKAVPFGPALKKHVAEARNGPAKLSSVDYSGDKLPDSFDWRNVNGKSYVPPPFDQMKCGSCYICAANYMMMSRIMVHDQTPGQYPKLSVQHVVDCNGYSQGCDGGLGEQVGRFAEDVGILTEDSYGQYNGQDNECNAKKLKGDRYHFTATQLLGGYQGGVTDPVEMQWELYRYGPMAVGVFVDDKYFYEYDPYGFDNSINLTDSEDPDRHYFFDEINHAVLLVGWVTEPVEDGSHNETFWIIQNSWGSDWGDNGAMKIAMGVNAYGIETQPLTTYYYPDGAVTYKSEESLMTAIIALGIVCVVLLALVIIFSLVKCKNQNYQQLNPEQ